MIASEESVFTATSVISLEIHPIAYASYGITEAEVLTNLDKLGFQIAERDKDVLCLKNVTQ